MLRIASVFLATVAFSTLAMAQSTWYVPDDFTTIQSALADATVLDGDTIIVRAGTYTENLDYLGKAVTLQSEHGPEVTIIDGNQSGSVVSFVNGEQFDSVIKGFTITNGSGTAWYSDLCGGGIYCLGSSPEITNNWIKENSVGSASGSPGYGGGIECIVQSSPLISCNVISQNQAFGYSTGAGGGIDCYQDSFPVIESNLITDNFASHFGGAINTGTEITIRDNRITGNICSGSGGGIYCGTNELVVILNNSICENYAVAGGAIYIGRGSVLNNRILDNEAVFGGGIYCAYWLAGTGDPVLANNMICGNSAEEWGGGIHVNSDSAPQMSNMTLQGNSASFGGGICTYGSTSIDAKNLIVWGNTAAQGHQICIQTGGSLGISYSDVQGGLAQTWKDPGASISWGTGMIDSDPLFADGANRDFHLTFQSPCKDGGDSVGLLDPADFEGDPRPAYSDADMGADEFHPRLYYVGQAHPGASVELKFVGYPGHKINGLIMGVTIFDPPLFSDYGLWYMDYPMVIVTGLGFISGNGISVIPGTIPLFPPAPHTIYLQAAINFQLTNLSTLVVE